MCAVLLGGGVAACGSGSAAGRGTGAPGTTTLQLALSGPASNTGGVFDGGAVSAYWPTAFQDQQELKAGRGVNVFDPADPAAAAALSPVELSSGGSGWILSEKWGKQHKDTVEKFLKAELAAAQWIKSHTVAQQAQVVAKHFPDLPYATTLANVTATYQTVDYSLVMPPAALTANVTLAKDSGEIPADAGVPGKFVFDPSFLNDLGADE